jgi:hypothetical protein
LLFFFIDLAKRRLASFSEKLDFDDRKFGHFLFMRSCIRLRVDTIVDEAELIFVRTE